jgi:isopenicillin-N epimerase
MTSDWLLDPSVTFLNHGSFGSCPRHVLEDQQRWRERLEHEPVVFMDRQLERLLDEARVHLAEFVDADPQDLAFLPNATAGVNTVLRSLALRPGDEILSTDHEYNACLNAARFAAETSGGRLVVARIPFPARSPGEVRDAILAGVTPRTRIALISHITSPTALIFPIRELVAELASRGIDTLVDGAHAVGMVPLSLRDVGATYYAGNCHKWLCGPKGSGFLHVRRDRQRDLRPLVISHGANSPRTDRARFLLEFDWTGTVDPTAYLAIPAAIRYLGSLRPGGWPEIMESNRRLCQEAREILRHDLGLATSAPDEMLGSMATFVLGPAGELSAAGSTAPRDPLQDQLFDRFRIEIPVWSWPRDPGQGRQQQRLLRISAALYNRPEQYHELAVALRQLTPSDVPALH